MVKIIALNCLCADVFDKTGEMYAGGEAMNFSAAVCRYDHVEASIMGTVGRDEYGKKILEEIDKRPINRDFVRIVEGEATASNITYLTEDGDRYYKCHSWTGGAYQNFELSQADRERLLESDVVQITYNSTVFDEVLELKKQGKFKLSADFNVNRNFESLEKAAAFCDFFFISAADDSKRVLSVLKSWSEKYDGIFVGTLAEKGSVAFKNGKEYHAEAIKVSSIVDTTGCGDSYQAGFIGEFTRNGDIEKAMEEGSLVASHTLSHMGGLDV